MVGKASTACHSASFKGNASQTTKKNKNCGNHPSGQHTFREPLAH